MEDPALLFFKNIIRIIINSYILHTPWYFKMIMLWVCRWSLTVQFGLNSGEVSTGQITDRLQSNQHGETVQPTRALRLQLYKPVCTGTQPPQPRLTPPEPFLGPCLWEPPSKSCRDHSPSVTLSGILFSKWNPALSSCWEGGGGQALSDKTPPSPSPVFFQVPITVQKSNQVVKNKGYFYPSGGEVGNDWVTKHGGSLVSRSRPCGSIPEGLVLSWGFVAPLWISTSILSAPRAIFLNLVWMGLTWVKYHCSYQKVKCMVFFNKNSECDHFIYRIAKVSSLTFSANTTHDRFRYCSVDFAIQL